MPFYTVLFDLVLGSSNIYVKMTLFIYVHLVDAFFNGDYENVYLFFGFFSEGIGISSLVRGFD